MTTFHSATWKKFIRINLDQNVRSNDSQIAYNSSTYLSIYISYTSNNLDEFKLMKRWVSMIVHILGDSLQISFRIKV